MLIHIGLFAGWPNSAITNAAVYLNNGNITDTRYMFYSCFIGEAPNFDTSKVNNMWYMFWDCHNLTNLPNYNTSNVTNFGQTFINCHSLKNVPNFDTSNAKYMSRMFANCWNLQEAPYLNTAKVTSMANMFEITNLRNIPQYDTTNVTDMRCMFYYCNYLTDNAIQNIINMILNSNIPSSYKNLRTNNWNSPFMSTNITSSRYSNRLSELAAAGWVY